MNKNYYNRISKLFVTLKNIESLWDNSLPDKVGDWEGQKHFLSINYPFTMSFDELVAEYQEVFWDEIKIGEKKPYTEITYKDTSAKYTLLGEIRTMCNLIYDFYYINNGNDKEPFLKKISFVTKGDLLENVIKWHNSCAKNFGTNQQTPIILKEDDK